MKTLQKIGKIPTETFIYTLGEKIQKEVYI